MKMVRRGDRNVQLVTQARRSMSEDIAYRQRRYLILMGFRAACFGLTILLFVNHLGWLAAIPAVFAIFVPYVAVVFANGGREPDKRRGFLEYPQNPRNGTTCLVRCRQAAVSKSSATRPRVHNVRERGTAAGTVTRTDPRWARNWVLTHTGGFPCSIHIGALVPRRGTAAGVPGPRRNADECDAGWFAPVATRRRSISGGHS